jgi:conjugative transfer signal peptidase TraF
MNRRRAFIIALTAAAVLALSASRNLPKLLLWNASASVPIGLYALQPAVALHTGELVAIMPPAPLARYLAARGYLPNGVPLLKHILALRSQTVCRIGRVVSIDGVAAANALDRDRLGRSLPVWQGCRTLRAGEVFLLNSNIRDSFDGRYFGPLPAVSIIGRAEPLWIIREK